MKIIVEAGRKMIPIFYCHPNGKKFVQFVKPNNFPTTFEIPDGSKILDECMNPIIPKKVNADA